MTTRLFIALYISLFISMFVLLFSDSPLGWVLFVFVFIAVFGGLFFFSRPFVVAGAFLLVGLGVWGSGLWLGWQQIAAGLQWRDWLTLGVGAWLAALATATLASLIWDGRPASITRA
jgi:hypothetical protein